ncbi:hypothetical protein NPIL_434061 [Nephila pilipes]|uniref:Uncharacterized protein n=1 Tax=Nephila pilipes TaxID=299642 RepID=A0A8X6UKK0_NEPPI|nr:hypothetical protein NPIL_434061 [Nephila pilipes]
MYRSWKTCLTDGDRRSIVIPSGYSHGKDTGQYERSILSVEMIWIRTIGKHDSVLLFKPIGDEMTGHIKNDNREMQADKNE